MLALGRRIKDGKRENDGTFHLLRPRSIVLFVVLPSFACLLNITTGNLFCVGDDLVSVLFVVFM